EIYVTDTFWPDFSKEDFSTSISNFQNRERRFGLTSAQLK
ncbi:MAG: undecaprenyl diphosphate synthase family protein, partial [Duncaniella sp.]|nr:undecaprenyl diphosphate synthase family protein [Duncaniella sp.]